MAKYVLNTVSGQSNIVNGNNLFSHPDFSANCKLVSSANQTLITQAQAEAARSISGLYYGIAKWVLGFAPLAQTETCLICADDAKIAEMYPNSQLKLKTSDFNTVVTNMAKGVSDYNAALKEFNSILVKYLKWYFINNSTSSANCSDIMNKITARRIFCEGQSSCETLTKEYLAKTALEYETLVTKVTALYNAPLTSSRRLMGSRLLATVASDTGYVKLSTYTGITKQVTINGMTVDQLAKAGGWTLQAAAALIAILAFAL
jgi:hypothetical protein